MTEIFDAKYPGPISLGVDLITEHADRYNARALVLYVSYLRTRVICRQKNCHCRHCIDWLEVAEMLNTIFIRNKLMQTIREATFQLQLTSHPAYRSFWTNMQGVQQIMPDDSTR